MSTTIKSAGPETPLTIRDSTGVGVCIDIGDGWEGGYFPRADFLAAVATECNVRIVPADAIVIERGELPEVEYVGTADGLGGRMARFSAGGFTGYADDRTDGHRAVARAHLALAEYIDANPPVDEVMVDTLAAALMSVSPASSSDFTSKAARRLYLAGVRIKAAK